MNQLHLTECEKAFLSDVIKNNQEWADYLTDQLKNARIKAKDYTGVGVYIDFEVNEENISVKGKTNVPLIFEGAGGIAPDRSEAADFFLYTKESKDKKSRVIDFVEIVSTSPYYDEAEVYSWIDK